MNINHNFFLLLTPINWLICTLKGTYSQEHTLSFVALSSPAVWRKSRNYLTADVRTSGSSIIFKTAAYKIGVPYSGFQFGLWVSRLEGGNWVIHTGSKLGWLCLDDLTLLPWSIWAWKLWHASRESSLSFLCPQCPGEGEVRKTEVTKQLDTSEEKQTHISFTSGWNTKGKEAEVCLLFRCTRFAWLLLNILFKFNILGKTASDLLSQGVYYSREENKATDMPLVMSLTYMN